jgi:hypothetical protein
MWRATQGNRIRIFPQSKDFMTFIPCYDLSENARLRADVYILSYISNAIALESHPFPNFFKKF